MALRRSPFASWRMSSRTCSQRCQDVVTYPGISLDALGMGDHFDASLAAVGRKGSKAELGATRCEWLDNSAVSLNWTPLGLDATKLPLTE